MRDKKLIIAEENEIKVFGSVCPIFRGNRVIKFITKVTIKDLLEICGKDKVVYDELTQRGFNDIDKQEIICSKKNIQEMKRKIVNNEFFDGNHLTWNVRIDDVTNSKSFYEYNPEENSLVLKTPTVTLPDSAQRHKVFSELQNVNSLNMDNFEMPLDICLYTFKEEQNLFSEINGCGEKANKTRSLFLLNSSKANLLKTAIEESELKDRVEVKKSTVGKDQKITTFSRLYDSLFDERNGVYKIVAEDDEEDLKNWVVDFYNYLFEIRPELKENLEGRIDFLSSKSMSFGLYASLIKALEGKRTWKKYLDKISAQRVYKMGMWEGDFLSVNNPLWHNVCCIMNKKGQWKVLNGRRIESAFNEAVLRHVGLK